MYNFTSEIAKMNTDCTNCMDMCMCYRFTFQKVCKI